MMLYYIIIECKINNQYNRLHHCTSFKEPLVLVVHTHEHKLIQMMKLALTSFNPQ